MHDVGDPDQVSGTGFGVHTLVDVAARSAPAGCDDPLRDFEENLKRLFRPEADRPSVTRRRAFWPF